MTAVAHHRDASHPDALNVSTAELVQQLLSDATGRRAQQIGYPAATDVDVSVAMALFTIVLNDIRDPGRPGLFNNTMAVEQAVIKWCATLLGRSAHDRWGYISAGGTEGNLAGVHAGRYRLPGAVIYQSSAAHPVDRTSSRICGVVTPVGPAVTEIKRVNPRQRVRMISVIASVAERITQARLNGRLGEVRGLQTNLTPAQAELAAPERNTERRTVILLGLPQLPGGQP